MQFASLSGLWFSLSLPFIVILYLLKRRYVDTEVSSHLLWQRILREQEANRPWQRLRRQLLLWLQLLAAALCVLALMKPFVPGTGGGGTARVVFVLDASASMQASAGGVTRLQQAERQLLEFAREHAPNSEYTLLVMRDQPEVVMQRQAGIPALESAIRKVTPFYGKTAYQASLSLAAALTRDDPEAQVRIYTDGQWTENGSGISFAVPAAVERTELAGTHENVSIAQFGVKQGGSGSGYQAVAVVKNWGAAPASFEAALYADDKAVTIERLTLQPDEQQTVYFENLESAAVYKLALDVQDALAEDNTAYAFSEGGGRKRAAYVGSGSLFLEKALALAKIDLLKIQKSADGTYPLPTGTSPDLVILDGVSGAELPGEPWQRLLKSTPLWTFPPAAPSPSASRQVSPPYTIADHPVTRFIRLLDVNVAQADEAAGAGQKGAKPIVEAGRLPLLLAGTESGVPRLVFAFSLQQSDLALRAEFPILVQNAANWLTRQDGASLGRFVAGDRRELAIHPETARAVWKPESGQGAEQAAEQIGGAVAAVQTIPAAPGLYRFMEYDAQGNVVQSRLLESAIDSRESNINGKADLLPGATPGERTDSGNTDASRAAVSPDKEPFAVSLVPWIVAMLLILLLLEWEVYRRGHSV